MNTPSEYIYNEDYYNNIVKGIEECYDYDTLCSLENELFKFIMCIVKDYPKSRRNIVTDLSKDREIYDKKIKLNKSHITNASGDNH